MNWSQQQQVIFITRFQPKCCVTNPIKKPARIERYVPPGAIRSMQIAGISPGCCNETVIQKNIVPCLCVVRSGPAAVTPPQPPPPIPKIIVATGTGTAGKRLFYSNNDGITWSFTLGTSFTGIPGDVAKAGNTWIAVGFDGSGNTIVRSTDGITWSSVSGTRFAGIGYDVDGNGSGVWVAGGQTPALTYSLDDGVTWTNAGVSGVGGVCAAVAYGDGLWVASVPGLASSTNGINWTPCSGSTFGPSGSASDIAYGNGRWVAVGTDQASSPYGGTTIVTSTDGINWIPAVSGAFTSEYGTGVDYSPQQNRWVATGFTPSAVLVSSDGLNWSSAGVTGVPAAGLFNVTWTGTRWVAVGNLPNTIVWSLDGFTWVPASGTIPLSQGFGVGS
jgi:hypothetical protein